MCLRDKLICSVAILLAVALLIIAGNQLDFINSQRQEMKLIINEPLENAPPSLAFATVAMGAFRGLVVDVLWLRADRLKEEGQFFDAKQLAEWITILQPRFAKVWEFHAWNMAYNISVCFPDTQPQERFRWIKNGYELLRDRAIPMNPKSILLYRELSRIFHHKLGGVTDDAHKYYKLQLALAMEPLLGPADNEFFQKLVQTPSQWEHIVKDANIEPLITALKSADKTFNDTDDFVSNYLSLRQNPKKFKPQAFKVIDNFRGTKTLEKFDIFAKAYQLRNTWKLDPALMQQLNKTYGPADYSDPNNRFPLDWRHPSTHALYWAVKGLQMGSRQDFNIDETNTDRMVNHSLQNLFRNGKIFIHTSLADRQVNPVLQQADTDSNEPAVNKEIFLRTDLRMFEPYNKSTLKIMEKYKNIEKKGTIQSFRDGHRNMLTNALFSFYQAGLLRQAQRMYDQMRTLYPRKEFNKPLVAFVKDRLHDEIEHMEITNAQEMVQMMLMESYFRYAMRDDDEASGREKLAQQAYTRYQTQYEDEHGQDPHRINLPEFKLLRYFALMDFLNDPQYPLDLRQSLINRIKLERPDLAEQLEQVQKKLMEQYEKSDQQN